MSSTSEQQKERIEGKKQQEVVKDDEKKERPRKAKREAIQIYRPGMLRQQKLANKSDTEIKEQHQKSSLPNETVATTTKSSFVEKVEDIEKPVNKHYKPGNQEVLKNKKEKSTGKNKDVVINHIDKTKIREENTKIQKENKEYQSSKEQNYKQTKEEDKVCQNKKIQKSKHQKVESELTTAEMNHKKVEKKIDKHEGGRNSKRDYVYSNSTGSNTNIKQKNMQTSEEFIPVKTLIFENKSNLSQNITIAEDNKLSDPSKMVDSENSQNPKMAFSGESSIKNQNRSDVRDTTNKNQIRNENKNDVKQIKQIKSENLMNIKSSNKPKEGREKIKLDNTYKEKPNTEKNDSRIKDHVNNPSTSQQCLKEENKDIRTINVVSKERHPDRYEGSVNKPRTSQSVYQRINDNPPGTITLPNKKKEKEKNSIDELAAKVDQLAFAKQRKAKQISLRSRTFSENDGRPDTTEVRQKEIQSRGSSFKENNIKRNEILTQQRKLVPEVSCETVTRGKENSPFRNTKLDNENSKSVGGRGGKSYSSSRAQNRKNRGSSEPILSLKESSDLSPDQEVSYSQSHQTSERLRKDQYVIERKSESGKDQDHSLDDDGLESYKCNRKTAFGDSDSDDISRPNRLTTRKGRNSSIDKRSKEFKDMDESIKPMVFVDIDNEEEDWSAEVERDTSWCNQSFNAAQLERSNRKVVNLASSWGDEKSSMRYKHDSYDLENKRDKRESSVKVCRGESPLFRGGLIQLPKTTTTGSTDRSSPGITNLQSSNKTSASNPPVNQKLLYDPNNPSKPLAVMPSARDLPPSKKEPTQMQQKQDPNRKVNDAHGGFGGSEQSQETPNSQKVDPSLLYSLQRGEYDINYYVSSNQLPQEFRRIMDIRRHLQGCYKQLLVTDIRLCQEKNIEGNMWKTLYYTIIEKLREYIAHEPGLKERSLATLNLVVEDGLKYLTEILESLQSAYKYSIDEHIKDGGQDSSGHRNRVRLALSSSQKILLSLGDLARYKEQYNPQPNFIMAKKWYEMALQVQPRNGRPFNQLAIIAVTQKRPLDVVYYYVRSLTASNPFVSARDSLISMFEDIRKKYDASKEHPEAVKDSTNPKSGTDHGHKNTEGLRQEIWIRPDSGATHKRTLSQSTDDETTDEKEDELRKIPKDQLMKKFLTSYLHCHGMLFARVGLDFFTDVCKKMIQEFSVLLQTNPPRLTTIHLLQILAINMFAVENTEIKDPGVGATYRSAAQELALVLSLEMFGRLAELAVQLFPVHFQGSSNSPKQQQSLEPLAGSDPERLFTPVLAHFMPAIKTWCDWLMYFSSVWNPPPSAHEYQYKMGNTWSSVAALATIVHNLGTPDVCIEEIKDSSELIPIRLNEDNYLRGYDPLKEAHKKTYYTSQYSHTGRAEDWLRVKQLQISLCTFLRGTDPPVLDLKKTADGDILVSVVDTSRPDTPTSDGLSLCISDIEDSETSESEEEAEEDYNDNHGTADDETLRKRLFARKKLLEKKQRNHRRLQQTMLENAVTVEIEVRPRYLIPDTNCFIQYLDVIQRLVELPSYTLMVPLVVLNELNGLQRDAAVAKYGSVGHAIKVREGAASAVHYLNSSKNPSIKCVTAHGSVLSSTTFTAELDMPDATNDDKILSCCVHFQGDAQRRPVKAGVRRLYREVVLLTEDRNLRVKAHGRDVPVRDLIDFATWAGVK